MTYKGINFRATSGFVTDAAGETYALGEAYPTTRGGLTFGWSVSNTANTRDRAVIAGQEQTAGINFTGNTASIDFRIDLPSTGAATIRLASGDGGGGSANHVQLLDGGVVFATIAGDLASSLWLDATGVARSNWNATNAPITHTFTSTNFTIRAGDGTSTGNTMLTHVDFDIAAADTTAPAVSSASVANSTPTVLNINMTEAMDTGSVPAASAFTVSGHTVSSVAITGSTINLTLATPFVFGEAARTVSYTQPGTNNARDLATTPNLLANFSAQAITNNVAAPTPVSFSGTVPTRNGVVSTAASFTNAGFFAGAATPFAYTLQAGTLPAGLTLGASTGIISGTPTTAGTSSGIVIRATDTASNTADTNSYSIVIAATNASPTFPGTISNISGAAGSAITPVNVSGQFSDTDALTYAASPAGTAWPSGLVVNSSTGIISGTVAAAGTTTGIKVRATDTASQTVDSNAFNAVIAAAPVNPTVTWPAPLCLAMGGLPLASELFHVRFESKTDLAAAALVLVDKTTDSVGNVTAWQQAGLTSGVTVRMRAFRASDGHEGYYDVTPV
jgi:hypothetical protein